MKYLGALLLAIGWVVINFMVYLWGEEIKNDNENRK